MKDIIKKRIVPVLCAVMLISLASCISVNLPPKDTQGETSAEEETESAAATDYGYSIVENDFIRVKDKYLNIIGRADYNGAAYMIATPSPSLIEEDGSPSAMSEFVARRNRELEERFNVKISCRTVDPVSMFDEVQASCLANDFYADTLMIPQYYLHAYIASGLLMNMNSLPFADFESGFNMESGVNAGSAISAVYAVGGWATMDPGGLPAVFFNKEYVEKTGLEDPYLLVRNGEWTWDKYFEYTAALPDLNAERDTSKEILIYSCGSKNDASSLADIIYFSEGNKFVLSGRGQYPMIAMDGQSAAHTVATARKVYSDPDRIMDPAQAQDVFASGGAMFLIDRLDTMKTIAPSDAVWGVLPVPKKSAEQEKYYSLVPPETLMFAVPANSTGAEKVSRMISALAACSLGSSVDAYVTDCMNYYLRDNNSTFSVEKICYGAVWDMAYSLAGHDTNISDCTYSAVRGVAAGDAELDQYINTYANGASAAMARLFS